jgi:glycosyltransferase involved in cell wall biosynthesis
MFKGFGSMGNVSTQLARGIESRIGSLGIYSYDGVPFADPVLQRYSGIVTDPKIALFLGMPDRSHLPPGFFSCPMTIGFFVCETDRIHCDWARLCNDFDLIVVPSRFCRTAFQESGVKSPVLVVPHGLEPEYRSYRDITFTEPLIFFNTFSVSSMAERKSAEELVRCFTATFDSPAQARLRLRTQSTVAMQRLLRKYDHKRVVDLVPFQEVSTEEFARQYSEVHCTVHPSKGEGFGLVPFQSIACERPVIAAPVTGMRDYLNAGNAILLRTNDRVPGVGMGNQCGTYHAIDERHLCECLRQAASNWHDEYEKVKKIAPAFRHRNQWSLVLAEFLSMIEELLSSESFEKTKKRILERARAVGGEDP